MDIFEILRLQEENYTSGYTSKGKFVKRSMYDVINKIDAYLFSTHISGKTDSLGRQKPFFNICTAVSNIWYRATDLDRKDVQIIPTESQQVGLAFVATVLLQEWMNKEKFGHFLNDWGRTLARYGSSVVKFVNKGGRLIPSVVSWDNLIVDPVDFYSAPVIEKFYLTPAQIRQNKNYDKEVVESLLEKTTTRKTLSGQEINNKDNYIEVYEIHGNLPLSLMTGKEEDKDTYTDQMWVVSYLQNDSEFDNFALYKGKEEKNPYMITHLIEEPGQTLAIGAVEHLFDAQWMVNHSIKETKDYLSLASKLIYQTSDPKFLGRNVLSAIETGEILIHQPNQQITQVNNAVGNISALMSFGQQWQSLGRELTSTPDAMRGNTMPSGTPYSLGAILQQQAGSLFEVMTENKGLYLEDMLREYIIPFLKTKMDTTEEIGAILDDKGIAEIDAMFVPREAIRRYNKEAIDKVLNDEIPSPYQAETAEAGVRKDLSAFGNMRFIKPSEVSTKSWKKVLEDFEWKVKVNVSNEVQDKQAVMQTLSTVLQTIGSNPAILQDPNAKMLFNKILKETAIVSPIEFQSSPIQPSVMGQPVMGNPAGDVANLINK